MPKLVCQVCNTIRDVPTCCNNSMIIKGNLLCCCSDNSKECGYQPIPECCGRKMNYVDY